MNLQLNYQLRRPVSRFPLEEVTFAPADDEYEYVYLTNRQGRMATWDHRVVFQYAPDSTLQDNRRYYELSLMDKNWVVVGRFAVAPLRFPADDENMAIGTAARLIALEQQLDTALYVDWREVTCEEGTCHLASV